MKKRFFRAGAMIALAAGMLVVFGVSCQRNKNQAPDVSSEVSTTSSAVSTTPKETVPEGPALEALPAQFLNDYAENEVAADARYKGKLVKMWWARCPLTEKARGFYFFFV